MNNGEKRTTKKDNKNKKPKKTRSDKKNWRGNGNHKRDKKGDEKTTERLVMINLTSESSWKQKYETHLMNSR